MTKCEEYKQLSNGTNKYNCLTCYHNKVKTCENWEIDKVCAYWYDPDSKIQGLAYNNEKIDRLPLFEMIK